MRIWREYRFEAAHWLPKVPQGHKCAREHGHSYRVRVTVEGELTDGMIMDFADLDEVINPLIDRLDHRMLNDVVENPTSEELAKHLGEHLRDWVAEVEVSETERSGAIYP